MNKDRKNDLMKELLYKDMIDNAKSPQEVREIMDAINKSERENDYIHAIIYLFFMVLVVIGIVILC